MRKRTIEEFIKISNEIHDNKYDYSLSIYKNTSIKLTIICPIHGEFEQTPEKHLIGRGCSKCGVKKSSIKRTSDIENFIKKSKLIHNNKYDYSLSIYKNNNTKLIIICPIHGQFEQRPNNHFHSGCIKCGIETCNKLNTYKIDYLIESFNKIHNFKYSYNVDNNYKNTNSIINIICPIHGEFKQRAISHLRNHGCNNCGIIKQGNDKKMSLSEFIEKSNYIHNYKYSYDKVSYINSQTKVIIICPIHGEFNQIPNSHLKNGCFKCGRSITGEKNKLGLNNFILNSNKLHNNKYDYSLVDRYEGYNQVINIICKKHGFFEQKVGNHLSGSGCINCKNSKGEVYIKNILDKYNINHESEKRFDNCKDKRSLPFDFYLPNINMLIEFDGIQHYEAHEFFGGEEAFEKTKIRDEIKNEYCLNNNIKLLRIPYYEIENIESILKKELNIND